MSLKILYVYKTTKFNVMMGSIEPILMKPDNGIPRPPPAALTQATGVLEPGVYRMPMETRFEPVNGAAPADYEVQPQLTGPGGKDSGPPDPPPHAITVFNHLSPQELKRQIGVATNGQGEVGTLSRKR